MWAAFEFDNVKWGGADMKVVFHVMGFQEFILPFKWMMDEYHVCLSIECIMLDENLGLLDQNTSFEGWVFSIEKMVQIFIFIFWFPFHECRKCDGMCHLNLTIFCDGCILKFFGFWMNEWMNEWSGKTRIHWGTKIYITWRVTLLTNGSKTHFDGFESKKIWWCKIYILGTFNSDVLKDMFGLCDPAPMDHLYLLEPCDDLVDYGWITSELLRVHLGNLLCKPSCFPLTIPR